MANQPTSGDAQSPAPLYRESRPTAVWVASALLLLLAMVNGLVAILGPAAGRVSDLFGWVAGAQAVLLAVLAIFLFRGASWARFTIIALVLLGVALAIYSWVSTGSGPGCLTLLPQIIILVLVLQRPVADWCYDR